MTTAVATRRVRITTREEMEPGAGDVPGNCGDSANGHPAPSFEGSASGSDAAGAIRARRAVCEPGPGPNPGVAPHVFTSSPQGRKERVIFAASNVAIVAIAVVIVVALLALIYILPRGGRRRR
jgi:hypothetical protein